MVFVTIFLLCGIVSVAEGIMVSLEADRPFVRMEVSGKVTLECCYNTTDSVKFTWMVIKMTANHTNGNPVNVTEGRVNIGQSSSSIHSWCHKLDLIQLQFSDAGLYRCLLHSDGKREVVMSHGTFLQVYKPMEKILNLTENVKNSILTAQGILLLLCVLLPGAKLLCKSKHIYALEKKKAMKEEENIYEGLRIEDFSSPYDQIQRAPAEVTYQDVYMSEGEASLEKP